MNAWKIAIVAPMSLGLSSPLVLSADLRIYKRVYVEPMDGKLSMSPHARTEAHTICRGICYNTSSSTGPGSSASSPQSSTSSAISNHLIA